MKKFLNTIEEKICGLALAIMLAILSYQVFARFLQSSNNWSEEVARYLFVALVFIGASYAVTKHMHIIIETATLIWPKKIRKYMQLLGILVWLAFSIYITYWGVKYCIMLWTAKRISLSIFINMAIPYAAIPLGYGLSCIRLIQFEVIPRIKAIISGEEELSLKEQMEQVAKEELAAAEAAAEGGDEA